MLSTSPHLLGFLACVSLQERNCSRMKTLLNSCRLHQSEHDPIFCCQELKKKQKTPVSLLAVCSTPWCSKLLEGLRFLWFKRSILKRKGEISDVV